MEGDERMIAWPDLPYEVVGKLVVAVIALAALIATIGFVLFAFGFVWARGWTWVSNTAWRGYDPTEDRPPRWRLRIAGVTIALARFKFKKIPAAYREADELAEDEMTARVALRRYLSAVFMGDEE